MLGKRLRENRGKRTQDEIAKMLGISRARYSHYENEHVQPDNDMLQKMADLYNVSVDYLLGRTETPNEIIKEDPLEGLSEWRKKAIEEIWKMSEEEVNYFYDLMKRIKK